MPWSTNHKTQKKFNSRSTVSVERISSRHANKVRSRIEISQKRRAQLRTLENPLLFYNLVKKLQEENPDFDPELINRTLEPDEALHDLKKRLPGLIIGGESKQFDSFREFREYLRDHGIDNESLQNLIIRDPNPPTDAELAQLEYALHGRPVRAKIIDRAKKAPKAQNFRQWMNNPGRTDIKGEDSIGTKTDLSEKLGI